MNIPDIKLVPCAIVKEKVAMFYCRDCFFFGKEYCKQYQIEVSETDGCSNYEFYYQKGGYYNETKNKGRTEGIS